MTRLDKMIEHLKDDECAEELEALRAVVRAAQSSANSLLWWFDGYDRSMVLRCVGCDFEQSEGHHADCLAGKLHAALEKVKS